MPEHPQGVCLDRTYDHDSVREILAELQFRYRLAAPGDAWWVPLLILLSGKV